jgi:hypothetical protein
MTKTSAPDEAEAVRSDEDSDPGDRAGAAQTASAPDPTDLNATQQLSREALAALLEEVRRSQKKPDTGGGDATTQETAAEPESSSKEEVEE